MGKKEAREKKENSPPTLERLRAALLLSLKGWHDNKMVCISALGDWNPRKGQQPFRPNSHGVGNRITTLR